MFTLHVNAVVGTNFCQVTRLSRAISCSRRRVVGCQLLGEVITAPIWQNLAF